MRKTASLQCFDENVKTAGCDEAGRGCLAGPVAAAAVILPSGFSHPLLNDSKKLSGKQRDELRVVIEADSLAWGVAFVNNQAIDQYNILRASIMAMHKALDQLREKPLQIIVDGNHFTPYREIPHECIIRGDGRYLSIAAASVLAKTHRDAFMRKLHNEFPVYGWDSNKGYPTAKHKQAISRYGLSKYHRLTYGNAAGQTKIQFQH